jgi:hypothetical protein
MITSLRTFDTGIAGELAVIWSRDKRRTSTPCLQWLPTAQTDNRLPLAEPVRASEQIFEEDICREEGRVLVEVLDQGGR